MDLHEIGVRFGSKSKTEKYDHRITQSMIYFSFFILISV